MKNLILILFLMSLIACSEESGDNTSKAKNEHIWKHQTDALKKTEDLAKQLEKEFKKKMEQMEKAQE